MKYQKKYEVDLENFIESLLIKKGVLNPASYLFTTKEMEHDALSIKNIERGCQLLIKHLNENNNIFIQIDSDMDGYMSAAILYNYIKEVYPDSKITWEVHEGKQHGINLEYIPDNCSLAIFPDAGSNDFEEHRYLKKIGTDVLIIDHHECSHESATAIVVNNQLGNYPNKFLSGGGVVYKFIQVMDILLGISNSQSYLGLAAISIVGDMMDLRDFENRYLVSEGLSQIENPGIEQIIAVQSFSIYGETTTYKDGGPVTPANIAWYVVPLVNALVRVGTQEEKRILFKSFIDGDKLIASTKRGAKGTFERVSEQAVRNCVNSRNRQNRTKEKMIDALEMQIKKENLNDNKVLFIIVDDKSFDTTLTGLVAMYFLSKYKKPTIVARESENGFYRGSARGATTTGIKDLKSFFDESGLFQYVQGHANAFGISIPVKDKDRLIDYCNETLKSFDFNENVYEVDLIFKAEEDIEEFISEIGNLSNVWGQGIDEPLIVVEDIPLSYDLISFIGKDSSTVRFNYGGVTYLKFKDKKLVEELESLEGSFKISIVGKAKNNEWNGNITAQIFIDEYQIKNTKYDF